MTSDGDIKDLKSGVVHSVKEVEIHEGKTGEIVEVNKGLTVSSASRPADATLTRRPTA